MTPWYQDGRQCDTCGITRFEDDVLFTTLPANNIDVRNNINATVMLIEISRQVSRDLFAMGFYMQSKFHSAF
jgi:hypothetical protein